MAGYPDRRIEVGQKHGHREVLQFLGYHFNHKYWLVLCHGCNQTQKVYSGQLRATKVCDGCQRAQRKKMTQSTYKKPQGAVGLNNLFRNYEARAKKRNLDWELTKDEFKSITSENCYYCNDIPRGILTSANKTEDQLRRQYNSYLYNGIDRIENHIGYALENCVPCCKTCNFAKSTMTADEFYDWIRRVHAHTKDR